MKDHSLSVGRFALNRVAVAAAVAVLSALPISASALGLGKLAKPSDTGRWWIDGNRLCQKFTSWYKGEPMCFELIRTGDKRLKWIRDNGQTGTARIGSSI